MKNKIFVIIPAYNEEGRIGKVIRGIDRNIVDRVIVVNDCSTDRTVKESQKAGAFVVSHGRNLGVGAAIKTGYREALKQNAKIILVIAGDGQHNPTEITKLIEPIIKKEADYVVGDRLSQNTLSGGMSKFRLFGNNLLTWLTRSFTKLDVKDAQCGYTAITEDALSRINLEFLTDRWGIPNDILFECSAKGLRVRYVPVETIYGGRKSYINPLKYFFRVSTILFRGYIRSLYFYHSLFVFSLTGAITLFIGFVFGLFILYKTLSSGHLPGTGSVVLDAILILVGIQFLIFGFLLDMIKMVESRISKRGD